MSAALSYRYFNELHNFTSAYTAAWLFYKVIWLHPTFKYACVIKNVSRLENEMSFLGSS